jgi:hypothetical protein
MIAKVFRDPTINERIQSARERVAAGELYTPAQRQQILARAKVAMQRVDDRLVEDYRNSWAGQKAEDEAQALMKMNEFSQRGEAEWRAERARQGFRDHHDDDPSNFITWRGQRIDLRQAWRGGGDQGVFRARRAELDIGRAQGDTER